MTEVQDGPAVFDLSEASSHDYRAGSRNVQIIFAAGLAILLATAVAVIATTPRFFLELSSVVIASIILIGFGSASVVAIFMFSPGAVRAEVSASGIRLGYGNGRTKELRWDRPGTTLTLWLSPESLPNGRPYPFARHEIRTVYPLDNSLTPDAFHAILEFARAAGLEVQTSPQRGRPARTVFRVRAKPHA